ncbi:Nucleotidylyl transferase superfamily protein isoform 1 [Theobroma cacao]|uniref:tryptophan--tRNA ligase n=1 Tax=Theobroma cacao TaxID=3641 RepID=A0A061GRP2_THECC|nr:Nucleotidylyl transferase superfamily protein isoform 1 [Theobroma cacao]EOY29790.1 Nucleotidylyl transferase superfamily protein isoform 1 [Theobroma cacao]
MGRAVLSQFLMLSNSAPRLSSSLSCGGLRSKYLKRPGLVRHNRAINGDNGSGFRCCCSVSLSQPATPETSSSSVKQRIVSGVQPTGAIHLGNYLGAIKNWIALQNSYDTLFFIVDLHAITLPYDTRQLSKATRNTAAIYLACGVDTSKASVFVQSHVRAHVELMWLLSSATPIGWLNRMIQFKEKSRKAGDENVGVALLTYPVLMASDILLYQSDFVPVGEDQKQHLELSRELAERVNYLYGGRKWKKLGGRGGAIFKVPEPLIPPAGARVMSLSDGLSKMSKSAPSDQSRINLLDPKDVIANKIKRCKTDSFPGLEFDNPERPECNNLLSIYQIISSKTKEEVAQECQDMNWGSFKTLLTDALVDHLHPIQVRYEDIISDPAYLDGVLAEGAEKAAAIADATLNNVYQVHEFFDGVASTSPLQTASPAGLCNLTDCLDDA